MEIYQIKDQERRPPIIITIHGKQFERKIRPKTKRRKLTKQERENLYLNTDTDTESEEEYETIEEAEFNDVYQRVKEAINKSIPFRNLFHLGYLGRSMTSKFKGTLGVKISTYENVNCFTNWETDIDKLKQHGKMMLLKLERKY